MRDGFNGTGAKSRPENKTFEGIRAMTAGFSPNTASLVYELRKGGASISEHDSLRDLASMMRDVHGRLLVLVGFSGDIQLDVDLQYLIRVIGARDPRKLPVSLWLMPGVRSVKSADLPKFSRILPSNCVTETSRELPKMIQRDLFGGKK